MKFLNGTIHSISAAALILGAATLLSRLLGLLRNRLLAGELGATRALDIYFAAFQIPDMLFTVFLLGAGSAAIMPALAAARKRGGGETRRLVAELVLVFTIGSAFLFIGAELGAWRLMRFIVPGFSVSELTEAVVLSRIMLVQSVILGLSNVASAVIQSERKFFIFALSAVSYNVGILVGILFLFPLLGISGVALGVVFGALLHLGVQMPAFFALGFTPVALARAVRRLSDIRWSVVGNVVWLSFPRVLALSVAQATNVALVAILSLLGEGSIAIFQFAHDLHFLPLGIIAGSFAVAAFPRLCEHAAEKNAHEFFRVFWVSTRAVLFWMLPISVFFFILRAQIVRAALGAGEFGWIETRLAAASLAFFALAILATAVRPLMVRALYALGSTWKPFFVNVAASLLTVGSAFLFLGWFRDRSGTLATLVAEFLHIADVSDITVLAIAAAIAVGSLANLLALSVLFRREARVHLEGRTHGDSAVRAILVMTLAAAISGGVGFVTLRAVNLAVSLDTFWGVLVQGGTAFAAGMAAYHAMLHALGVPEAREVVVLFRRRLVRLRVLPRELDSSNAR